jgi:hypothetical protein
LKFICEAMFVGFPSDSSPGPRSSRVPLLRAVYVVKGRAHQGRTIAHRLDGVDNGRQLFVLRLYQRQRIFRHVRVFRQDGGYGLAEEEDLVLGEDEAPAVGGVHLVRGGRRP